MKIKDLQYDDWIFYDPDYLKPETEKHRKTPAQVSEIRRSGITVDENIYYPPIEAIDDIPLTPEILISNGFIEMRQPESDTFRQDAFMMSLTKKQKFAISEYIIITKNESERFRWTFSIEMPGKMHGSIQFNSVRELQHFLRDADVQENIRL